MSYFHCVQCHGVKLLENCAGRAPGARRLICTACAEQAEAVSQKIKRQRQARAAKQAKP